MNSIDQHLASRRTACLFDFSFMSLIEVDGIAARAFLDYVQTRSLAALEAGRIVYALLLDEEATVFIDATLWKHADGRWWLFTGRRTDVDAVQVRARGFDVRVRERSDEFAVLALQGPTSGRMLASSPAKQSCGRSATSDTGAMRSSCFTCWIKTNWSFPFSG